MSDTRQHLLGYLLEALEPEEHELVERALQDDPRLLEDLERLAAKVEPLEHDREHHAPPDGLALRTCVWLATQVQADDDGDSAEDREKVSLPPARMTATRDAVRVSRWSMPDVVVTAGILLAAAVLFFPAIASSRIRSQVLNCQNNLRQLGLALNSYSNNNNDFFPQVPPTGNRSVAGNVAVTLRDQNFINDKNIFVCPSSELGRAAQTWRGVPSLAQVDSATPEELPALQRTMGGSYGYPMGYVSNGQYFPARNLHRPHFALMADAPSARLPGRTSLNHGGRGQNVLLEDGRIVFLPKAVIEALHDDIFLNQDAVPEAGLHVNDAVIGASGTRPLRFGLPQIAPGGSR